MFKLGDLIDPEELNWLKIQSALNKFDKKYAIQIKKSESMDVCQQTQNGKKVGSTHPKRKKAAQKS